MSTDYIWAVYAFGEWWLHGVTHGAPGHYRCTFDEATFIYHDLAAPIECPPVIDYEPVRLSRDEAQAIIASARAKEAMEPEPAEGVN